jgi:Arc/MetJ-type ribon-helix-helix transcriptional regulator
MDSIGSPGVEKNMPFFSDIPQYTRDATYKVDVGWDYLPLFYAHSVTKDRLNVCPDFQRGYVWTPEQRVRYIEFVLRGGATGQDIYTNCRGWRLGDSTDYVLVDGKQRLDAVLAFLSNEFPIFGGNFFRDYGDRLRTVKHRFHWHVNDLDTRDEVLQWYLDLNSGGTVHTKEELDHVRALIGSGNFDSPSDAEIHEAAKLHRSVVADAIAKLEAQRAELTAKAQAAPPPKVKRRR